MPTPIEYAAVLDLQTALRAISTGAGYYRTVQSAAVKLDPNVAIQNFLEGTGLRPFACIELDDTEQFEFEPASELRIKFPVLIHWIDTADGADDASLLLTYFQGCADVEKAITQDVSRGGRASDTRIKGRKLSFDGSQVWAELAVELWIRRQYGTPSA